MGGAGQPQATSRCSIDVPGLTLRMRLGVLTHWGKGQHASRCLCPDKQTQAPNRSLIGLTRRV